MVSGAFGVAIIGIGIIVALVLLPRQILSPEKLMGTIGGFVGAEPILQTPRETITPMGIQLISPKPKTQIISTKEFQRPVIVQEQMISPKPAQISGGSIFVKTEKNGFLQSIDPVTGERGGFQAELEKSGLTLEQFIRRFQPI